MDDGGHAGRVTLPDVETYGREARSPSERTGVSVLRVGKIEVA